jgi:hypothetical protein
MTRLDMLRSISCWSDSIGSPKSKFDARWSSIIGNAEILASHEPDEKSAECDSEIISELVVGISTLSGSGVVSFDVRG